MSLFHCDFSHVLAYVCCLSYDFVACSTRFFFAVPFYLYFACGNELKSKSCLDSVFQWNTWYFPIVALKTLLEKRYQNIYNDPHTSSAISRWRISFVGLSQSILLEYVQKSGGFCRWRLSRTNC
uniref:Uncharacterized protein n=1 Tax=Wuchereria bancrofti TaxID=6293 RepID=A0A1I8EKL3_WUCBA